MNNSLINITTDAQGAPVVSARELHSYLESKKQFADWIKIRIEKYGLIENQDYTTFSLIGEKGRPLVEYVLTLDMAKQLAMVENNTRGQQARHYFIDCEKKLHQYDLRTLHTIDRYLTPLMADQQRQINALHDEVGRLVGVVEQVVQKQPLGGSIPHQANADRQHREIVPPVSQNMPTLPFYPALAPPRSAYSGHSGGQRAVATIPAEVVRCIINLAYQDGLPRHYAELHSALAGAAPRIGWPLSKHRIETLIRRCVAEGYLIRFRPEGYTHPFYQPAQSGPLFRR